LYLVQLLSPDIILVLHVLIRVLWRVIMQIRSFHWHIRTIVLKISWGDLLSFRLWIVQMWIWVGWIRQSQHLPRWRLLIIRSLTEVPWWYPCMDRWLSWVIFVFSLSVELVGIVWNVDVSSWTGWLRIMIILIVSCRIAQIYLLDHASARLVFWSHVHTSVIRSTTYTTASSRTSRVGWFLIIKLA